MRRSAVILASILAGVLSAAHATLARRASPAPTPSSAACHAFAMVAKVAPGRYAVATTVTEPLDEVDVRVDVATGGYWIYKTTDPHTLLDVPDPNDVVAVQIISIRPSGASITTCGPSVGRTSEGAAAAKIIAAVPPGTPPLLPFASGVEAPLTCTHPYANTAALHAAEPTMPSPPTTGRVQVRVDLDEKSTIVGTSIWNSTNPALNASALAAARASTFQTEIKRCVPVPSSYLFSVEYDRY